MSEWKEYKLGEVADISTGYAFKGDEYEFKGKLRVVRGENVTIGNLRWDSEKYWNKSTDNLGQYFLEENDIVIGMDGSRVGHNRAKIKSQELPLILAQRVAKLRAKNNFDQSFLWYHIFSDIFKDYVEAIHTGTSIPHISQRQIADFEILAPKLKTEQTAIASVLSSLDDKIDLLHRQNATLEKMAETLFRQWFVEEAKEEWEVVKMESLISIGSGKGLKKESFIENGLYPILGANGEIGRTNEFLFDEKLIYTGRVGTLGNIFRIENEKVWLSDNTLIIKPIEYFNFIYLILKTSRLEDYNVGSTQPLIRQSDIKEIDVALPSKDKLIEFESLTDKIFQKIKSNQTQIRTLTALRDTLLPKLMSGEVKVEI